MLSQWASLRLPGSSIFQRTWSDLSSWLIIGLSQLAQGFDIKLEWVGFDKGESSWKPLANIWDGAPQFVKSELRELRLDQGVRSPSQTFYGISL